MSKKRTVIVSFRGERHEISAKHAAELYRRRHLRGTAGHYFIENDPYITVQKRDLRK